MNEIISLCIVTVSLKHSSQMFFRLDARNLTQEKISQSKGRCNLDSAGIPLRFMQKFKLGLRQTA